MGALGSCKVSLCQHNWGRLWIHWAPAVLTAKRNHELPGKSRNGHLVVTVLVYGGIHRKPAFEPPIIGGSCRFCPLTFSGTSCWYRFCPLGDYRINFLSIPQAEWSWNQLFGYTMYPYPLWLVLIIKLVLSYQKCQHWWMHHCLFI